MWITVVRGAPALLCCCKSDGPSPTGTGSILSRVTVESMIQYANCSLNSSKAEYLGDFCRRS